MNPTISAAITALRQGGVIAYPTEFCYGLGCNPRDQQAVEQILQIKQRDVSQGLILIAANLKQVVEYAVLDGLPNLTAIKDSWPGPNTWVLPAQTDTPAWIRGKHPSVALRVTNHPMVVELCNGFGGAIVSTSANRHGQDALKSFAEVFAEMGGEIDQVLDGELSHSGKDQAASNIFDGRTGKQLR